MKVLITGANGHLGAHLARALLSRGLEVRGLVRASSRITSLLGLDLDIVVGDVLDRDSIRRALRGCTHLYHLAAPTSLDQNVERIILDGTRMVLEEACKTRIARAVVTSSTVTVGYSSDPSIVLDEDSCQKSAATPYHAAKWEAEQLVVKFARSDLPAIIVNPSAMVGSLDFRITPSNAPIERCLQGGLPIAFSGGMTIVHAADVAQGHILAMEGGTPGERYILGGERLTIPDYFALIARICGKTGPRIIAPRWAMLGAGIGCNLARSLGIRSVPFTYGQVRNIVGRYAWYSSNKAHSVFGYRWRPASDAIADYVEWVRSGRPGERTG